MADPFYTDHANTIRYHETVAGIHVKTVKEALDILKQTTGGAGGLPQWQQEDW